MLHRFHDRFGTAGVVIAVIALVVALGGTAFAATKLNGTQKKEVEKIAKKFQGTGPAGANGTNGSPGANGKDGAPGANGINGTDGKSVEAEAAPPAKCSEGGTVFKIAGVEKGKACNGKEGEPGEEGSPWTAGGTLPPEATETGGWGTFSNTEDLTMSVVSFPVPLAAEIPSGNVHMEPAAFVGAPGEDCPGTAAAPAAKPGHFCAYATNGNSGTEWEFVAIRKLDELLLSGTSTSGAAISFAIAPNATVVGTWAVTECPESDPAPC